MQATDWGAFIGYAIPGVLGFAMRYCQERNKKPKPDVWIQIMASIFISYLAFFIWPSVKTFSMWEIHPFVYVHVFIATNSYFGSYIVTQSDRIVKMGWKQWFRARALDILAYTDKERTKR